jgi:hypothetical protein
MAAHQPRNILTCAHKCTHTHTHTRPMEIFTKRAEESLQTAQTLQAEGSEHPMEQGLTSHYGRSCFLFTQSFFSVLPC